MICVSDIFAPNSDILTSSTAICSASCLSGFGAVGCGYQRDRPTKTRREPWCAARMSCGGTVRAPRVVRRPPRAHATVASYASRTPENGTRRKNAAHGRSGGRHGRGVRRCENAAHGRERRPRTTAHGRSPDTRPVAACGGGALDVRVRGCGFRD